ncbi:16S rRNA (uracil(1498)-N(3))-methyltransferase [Gammaproteobacteria bacterium 45_16_T64]|nr:16S rRNA (uracil(1498)-N(3))-methyltransferase [Gammaproteobacteria bacterium 45_16_T64]
MNLILLHPHELVWQGDSDSRIDSAEAILRDRRFLHIQSIHKAEVGDLLRVGVINGSMGTGTVKHIGSNSITLQVVLHQHEPPPPLPVTILLSLPRPKMLRRILQTAASMGVKKLILINSYKVEKSYWQSPYLQEDSINEQLTLGLEQAVDTIMPEVVLKKRFKPFIEDELPAIANNKRCIIAHPELSAGICEASEQETVLAIGPEGGFIPYEVENLNAAGFKTVTLGTRILKVETAVPVLLSKLF